MLNKLMECKSLKELFMVKADLIREYESLVNQYAPALIDYATAFRRIKEEAYKITISECEKQAGEETGYRYKQIPEQIEVIKETISLCDDMIQSYQQGGLEYQTQTSLSNVLEPSSQTKWERKPKYSNKI